MKQLLILTILLLSTTICFSQFGDQEKREDRWSLVFGFDPKNAIVGGKKNENGVRRNPPGLVTNFGVSGNVSYWEIKFNVITFHHIEYYSVGLSFHREIVTLDLSSKRTGNESTFAVLIGAGSEIAAREEFPMFGNPEHHYFNYHISTRFRWDKILGSRFYTEAETRLTHRSDIKDLWGPNSNYGIWDNPSLYWTFGFYLN